MEKNVVKQPTENQRSVLKRLERFSRLMDSSITIPFTKIKLGLESIIGMLPGIGDTAGFFLSFYVLVEAHKIGATTKIKLKILGNIIIDFIGGLIPIAGDIFDIFFKANVRNTRLLQSHINEQLET